MGGVHSEDNADGVTSLKSDLKGGDVTSVMRQESESDQYRALGTAV